MGEIGEPAVLEREIRGQIREIGLAREQPFSKLGEARQRVVLGDL